MADNAAAMTGGDGNFRLHQAVSDQIPRAADEAYQTGGMLGARYTSCNMQVLDHRTVDSGERRGKALIPALYDSSRVRPPPS